MPQWYDDFPQFEALETGDMVTEALLIDSLAAGFRHLIDLHDHDASQDGDGGLISRIDTLATVNLGGTAAASVDQSGLAQTSTHMLVVGTIQNATDNDDMYVRFNNDSGANYRYEAAAGQTQFLPWGNQGNDATHAAAFAILIPNYTNTSFYKSCIFLSAKPSTAATPLFAFAGVGGAWISSSAVNRITFLYSTGNVADALIKFYGLP
jgi:hypothetical protein